MKPDWDKLMAEYKNSQDVGVYDVDCTGTGQDLCVAEGIQGYPTLKYGDASLDDSQGGKVSKLLPYKGGRDLASLRKFTEQNLGRQCGPDDLDTCDPSARAIVEAAMARSMDELKAEVKQLNDDMGAKEEMLKARGEEYVKALKLLEEEKQKFKEDSREHERRELRIFYHPEDSKKATQADKDQWKQEDKAVKRKAAYFDKREAKLEKDGKQLESDATDFTGEKAASPLKLLQRVLKWQKQKKKHNEL